MTRLITLEKWASETYGQQAPSIHTLRRWAREARIHPAPTKHGRAYFVSPDAKYVSISSVTSMPLQALPSTRAAQITSPSVRASSLIDRMVEGHGR